MSVPAGIFLDPVTGSLTIGVHKADDGGGGGLKLLVIVIRLDWIGLLFGTFVVDATTATIEDKKLCSLDWLDSNDGAVDGVITGRLDEFFTSCNNSCCSCCCCSTGKEEDEIVVLMDESGSDGTASTATNVGLPVVDCPRRLL